MAPTHDQHLNSGGYCPALRRAYQQRAGADRARSLKVGGGGHTSVQVLRGCRRKAMVTQKVFIQGKGGWLGCHSHSEPPPPQTTTTNILGPLRGGG